MILLSDIFTVVVNSVCGLLFVGKCVLVARSRGKR